jgi:hypothetical protein
MRCVTLEDVLQDLGKQGLKNLVVVPVSFTSEHVETLEEIDIEYREVANEVLSLSLALSLSRSLFLSLSLSRSLTHTLSVHTRIPVIYPEGTDI